MRKFLKYFFWLVVLVLVLVNAYIIFSGKTYIYSAVAKTYLQGDKGPTIYDLDKFSKKELPASSTPFQWSVHPLIQKASISAKQEERMIRNESTSFLVIKNDTILYERYWEDHQEDVLSNSFSMAKSLVAILIGVAIEEQKIHSLDDEIGLYISEFNGKPEGGITFRELLSMSSGLNWKESSKNPLSHNAEAYFGSDVTELILSLEKTENSGEVFKYLSGNTQVLALALTRATQKDLATYANEKIWSKLGTDHNAYWSTDENDIEKAYCCLYATTRDFAKLGRLMLNYGNWNGEQLVDSLYVNELVSPANILEPEGTKNDRYGLHWWLYPGERAPVFYARGIQGQFIICIPEENMVIVRTGHKREPLYSVPAGTDVPVFMEQLTGHPEDLRFYTSLAFLLDSQLQMEMKE